MKKDWGTYFCGRIGRAGSLSKQILDDVQNEVREEYNKLVEAGKLPDGQFDSFYAGYGIALLKQSTK